MTAFNFRSGGVGRAQFERALKSFGKLSIKRTNAAIAVAKREVKRSILDGSEITGAPGQPIKTGELYASWKERTRGKTWQFYSELFYAQFIEDNVRGYIHVVGGPHSVKLTRVSWRGIVRFSVQSVRNKRG